MSKHTRINSLELFVTATTDERQSKVRIGNKEVLETLGPESENLAVQLQE